MVLMIDKKRSIGDASIELGVPEHVIRFWETQFGNCIKPTIGNGRRRYYYNNDIKILSTIKEYLYEKGYTIKGLKKLIDSETILILESDEKKQINTNNENNELKITYLENKNYNINCDLKSFKNKLNDFYEKLKNI